MAELVPVVYYLRNGHAYTDQVLYYLEPESGILLAPDKKGVQGHGYKEMACLDQSVRKWRNASWGVREVRVLHKLDLQLQNAPTYKAPPLGLRPDYIAVAEYDKARCKEIGEAMARYATAMLPIPEAWINELNELIERNQPASDLEMPTNPTIQ